MASFVTKAFQKAVLIHSKYASAGTESTFMKTGQLTPAEFVAAGDYLVENYMSWQWVAGEEGKQRKDLPADKQYLQTRDVPCLPHPSSAVLGEERIVEDEDGDGWVEAGGGDDFGGGAEDGGGPAVGGGGGGGDDDVPEVGEDGTTVTSGGGAAAAPAVEEDDDDGDDDSDVPSLDEFDYDEAAVADDDPASMPAQPADAAAKDENVVKTRTYDISVTYDAHYSTPRVWLFGYDSAKNPLKDTEWQSDFSQEHLHKTVTHESHPHEGYSCPSIHPCKHAAAMLKMIELTVGDTDAVLDVALYMLIFLKFIQSIIPNIEYDYTGKFEIKSPDEAQ